MYKDYLDSIITFFKAAKEAGKVAHRLMRPTPASIKEECVSVCQLRYDKKDSKLLMSFFAPAENQDAMLKAIQRFDIDRFRPLVNFLKGKTSATDDLNIELLGWLADFPDRPFEKYRSQNSSIVDSSKQRFVFSEEKTGDSKVYATKEKNPEPDSIQEAPLAPEAAGLSEPAISSKKAPVALRKTIIVFVLILLLSLTIFFSRDKTPPLGILNSAPQKCMIWVGDHYITTSCNQKHGDTLVVAFEEDRFNNFKKVMRTDTITLFSAGRLWYIKKNGNIEVYTTAGMHPMEPNRILKPLTKYMIEKYFLSKNQLPNKR